MNRMNEWIALKITLAVSTMWAFYILVIYGLTPLLWPQYMDKILYWSNFIQLVFLPLLAVGGAVLDKRRQSRDRVHAEEVERRDIETHQWTKETLGELHEIVAELHDHHIGGRKHKELM